MGHYACAGLGEASHARAAPAPEGPVCGGSKRTGGSVRRCVPSPAADQRHSRSTVDIVIMRMRVLAETASCVWIAVSGTLGATTQHRMHQQLRGLTGPGHNAFSLDLRELRCAEGIAAEDVREAFFLGPAVVLHLIGAPAEIRVGLTGNPYVTLHPSLASAWEQWV